MKFSSKTKVNCLGNAHYAFRYNPPYARLALERDCGGQVPCSAMCAPYGRTVTEQEISKIKKIGLRHTFFWTSLIPDSVVHKQNRES